MSFPRSGENGFSGTEMEFSNAYRSAEANLELTEPVPKLPSNPQHVRHSVKTMQ